MTFANKQPSEANTSNPSASRCYYPTSQDSEIVSKRDASQLQEAEDLISKLRSQIDMLEVQFAQQREQASQNNSSSLSVGNIVFSY